MPKGDKVGSKGFLFHAPLLVNHRRFSDVNKDGASDPSVPPTKIAQRHGYENINKKIELICYSKFFADPILLREGQVLLCPVQHRRGLRCWPGGDMVQKRRPKNGKVYSGKFRFQPVIRVRGGGVLPLQGLLFGGRRRKRKQFGGRDLSRRAVQER